MYILEKHLYFPPVTDADESGLLAVGGDLSAERLLLAYQNGIFPWYNEEDPILWWSPSPRCVLFPEKLKISKTMQQVINRKIFRFTVNQSFENVIIQCKTIKRKEADGTWINEDIVNAYTKLHQIGYALSAEAWLGDELVGGLYGVKIGNVFFGESMFSKISNASKFAFISVVQYLQKQGVALIDCQMKTDHLISLGAEMIEQTHFQEILKKFCREC